MKVYGTKICKDCLEALEWMQQEQKEFEFIDITENTTNLKKFLKLRDTREEFTQIRENGTIGIPCFVSEEGRITFEWEDPEFQANTQEKG